jgi:hypothetical protein
MGLLWKKLPVVLIMLTLAVPFSIGVSFQAPTTVEAQGTNLLQSPQFTAGNYYTRDGIDGQIPGGWDVWSNGQPPASDYNQFLPYTRSAPGSWEMRGGFVAWTGGGLQQVSGVIPGATYRFTIYAFAWTCNDLEFSCTDAEGRTSDQSFNSQIRVGIDPTGGTDAGSGSIVWSGFGTSYDSFSPFTIDAVAQSGTITVFTYNTVSQPPPALRQMFWDDASLVQVGDDIAEIGEGGQPEQELNPPPDTVPFVQPQSAQPDGSVVHTVNEGDTVDSIYVAYRYLGLTRESFYALNGWEEPPRFIVPGEQILILPAGSVDPTTGQLLTGIGASSTSPPPAATAPPAADAGTGTGGTGTGTGTGTGAGTGGTGTGAGAPPPTQAPPAELDPGVPADIEKGG